MKILLLSAFLLAVAGVLGSGCDTGSAPTTPELFGPDTAGVGDTVTFRVWSSDADDDYISFWIVWGDTTTPGWSPYFSMLDTVERKHVFADPGNYGITARAQDLNGKKSDWSDTLRITVTQ